MPDLFPMIQVAVGKQQGAPESQRHVVLRIERIFRREVLTRILQRDGCAADMSQGSDMTVFSLVFRGLASSVEPESQWGGS